MQAKSRKTNPTALNLRMGLSSTAKTNQFIKYPGYLDNFSSRPIDGINSLIEPQPTDLVRLLRLEPDPQQDFVMICKDDVVDHRIKAVAAIHHTLHFARIIA